MLEKEKSIVVISTTISICIMLLMGIDKPFEKKMVSNYQTTKKQTQIQTQTIIDKPKKLDSTSKAFINSSGNKKENIAVEKTKKAIEVKPTEATNSNESEILKSPEENSVKAEDEPKTATVFKVNKNDIFGELSFFDKEKLLLISTKIKPSDYQKISDMLQSDIDGEGVLSTLKILKDRLSKNDYSKINQIFKKYINMELVNN